MWESLFNKVAGLQFSCEYCKIFKNICFGEHLRATASTSSRLEFAHILSGNIKEKKHKKNKKNETNQLKGITSGIGHFYIHIL